MQGARKGVCGGSTQGLSGLHAFFVVPRNTLFIIYNYKRRRYHYKMSTILSELSCSYLYGDPVEPHTANLCIGARLGLFYKRNMK